MTNIATPFVRVTEHWNADGIPTLPAQQTDIAALQRRLPEIPLDYLDFLDTAGIPTTEDSRGFRFWAPHEINCAKKTLNSAGYTTTPASDRTFVFADYMQESWWYGLRRDFPKETKVFIIQGVDNETISDPIETFEGFLQQYITDARSLYPNG